jgi:hypothetical protein
MTHLGLSSVNNTYIIFELPEVHCMVQKVQIICNFLLFEMKSH